MSEAESGRLPATPLLPKLILIADGFTREAVFDRAVEAVGAGVPWLHLRDHAASDADFLAACRRMVSVLESLRSKSIAWRKGHPPSSSFGGVRPLQRGTAVGPAAAPFLHQAAEPGTMNDVLVSVNGRLPMAAELGMGLHTGARGPKVTDAVRVLGDAALIGSSAHSAAEAAAAFRDGAHYVLASPVYPTSSKPGGATLGVEGLRKIIQRVPGRRVFALGGITPERVAACVGGGAYGVAVLSGILEAADVPGAVRAYLDALTIAERIDERHG